MIWYDMIYDMIAATLLWRCLCRETGGADPDADADRQGGSRGTEGQIRRRRQGLAQTRRQVVSRGERLGVFLCRTDVNTFETNV